MSRPPLILASQSPQRRRLLKSLRLPFRVEAPRVPEDSKERDPRRLVRELAVRKASWIAGKKRRGLVLGADTVVACSGKVFSKPQNSSESLRMLKLLNGRWHRVYTGVALVDALSGRTWREVAVSRVKARRLDGDSLRRMSGKHMDKAGSYAVQDRDDPFIERVVGPMDNVIGLPLANVRSVLRRAGRAPR